MEITHVIIGIASAHHAEGLARTLASLKTLTFTAHSAPTISVLVAGNEEQGPTRQVTEAEGNATYLYEPEASVSAARNRIIDNLPPGAELLVWLDDNSEVSGEWLAELLATFAKGEADIIMGALEARLPEGAAPWLAKGGFFNRRRMADRLALFEGLNNCLFSIAALQRAGLRFAPNWGSTGLAGALLLRQARRAGLRFGWEAAATATVHIPAARARFSWLWAHFNQVGVTSAYGTRKLEDKLSLRLLSGLGGLSEVARAILMLPLTIAGRHIGAEKLLRIAFGLGLIAGSLGARPK